MQTVTRFCQPDQAASAIGGRRLDRDEAVTLQKSDHFSHGRSLDIEPLGKSVDGDAFHLAQSGQRQELRDAQTGGLKMRVVEARNPARRLSRCEAGALVNSERLIEWRHLIVSIQKKRLSGSRVESVSRRDVASDRTEPSGLMRTLTRGTDPSGL